jgi:hypothetical protein
MLGFLLLDSFSPVVADAGAREQLRLAHTVNLDLDIDGVSWLCKQDGSPSDWRGPSKPGAVVGVPTGIREPPGVKDKPGKLGTRLTLNCSKARLEKVHPDGGGNANDTGIELQGAEEPQQKGLDA